MKFLILTRIILVLWLVAMAVGSHWPNLQVEQIAVQSGWKVPDLDKGFHVAGYAGLTILLLGSRLFSRRPRLNAAISAGVLLCYSAVDELTQGLVPGRTLALADWGASASGIAIGLLVWWVWRRIRGANHGLGSSR